MAEGKQKALSSSFLCSPIPKDPSQVFYVDDSSSVKVRATPTLDVLALLAATI